MNERTFIMIMIPEWPRGYGLLRVSGRMSRMATAHSFACLVNECTFISIRAEGAPVPLTHGQAAAPAKPGRRSAAMNDRRSERAAPMRLGLWGSSHDWESIRKREGLEIMRYRLCQDGARPPSQSSLAADPSGRAAIERLMTSRAPAARVRGFWGRPEARAQAAPAPLGAACGRGRSREEVHCHVG